MKCIVTIDKNCSEEVHIFARERTKLVDEIKSLVENGAKEITAYYNGEAYIVTPAEVFCFAVENNKVYALTRNNKLYVKQRLYQLEEMLDGSFIKINQSCIVNVKLISNFSAAFSGALKVTLKNGYIDYVSRRNIKAVKERLGVK